MPGHGDHAGRAFADAQAASFAALADLARRVHAGDLTLDDAVAATPFPISRPRTSDARSNARSRSSAASSTERSGYPPTRTIQRPRAEPATIPSSAVVERRRG